MKQFPEEVAHAVGLGGSYCNFGHLVRKGGAPAEALDWYARATRILQAVLDRDPRLATARRFLRNAHHGRADVLTRLGRYAEALPDWEKAVELTEGPARAGLRLQRALVLARLKEHARAAAEADELARARDAGASTLYGLACVFALSAPAAGDDRAQAEAYAARAVELLRRAADAGFKDVERLKKDADLDALRSREDFQALLRGPADRR